MSYGRFELSGRISVELGAEAIGIVAEIVDRRLFEVVGRQEAEQEPHVVEACLLVVGDERRHARLRRVRHGAAELLERDLLTGDRLHDVGARDEHVRRLAHHEDEVGHRRRVDRTTGARPEDHRDLRDDTGRLHVAAEDAAVAGKAHHTLLDAGTGAVVEPDHRRAGLEREVHQLVDLLGEHLAERTAEHREVLAEHEHLAAVDRAPAGDDTVGVGTVVEPCVVGAMPSEHVELVEAAVVEQVVDPFTSEHLALGVLPLDRSLRTGVHCRIATGVEVVDLLLHRGHAPHATSPKVTGGKGALGIRPDRRTRAKPSDDRRGHPSQRSVGRATGTAGCGSLGLEASPQLRRHVATTSPTPTSTRFAASPSGTNESTAATGTADCGSLGLEASPQHRRHVATTSPTPTSTRFAASPSGTNRPQRREPRTVDRWASKRHPSIRRHVATTSPTPTSTRFAASPSGTNESTAATGTADCGSLGLEASPQHPAARGDHVADTDEHEVRSIAERHERIDRSDGDRGLWIVGPRSVTPASGGTWRPRRRHRRARGSRHRRAARTNRPQRPVRSGR